MKAFAVTAVALLCLVGCYPVDVGQSTEPHFAASALRSSAIITAASEIAETRANRQDLRRFAASVAATHKVVIQQWQPQSQPGVLAAKLAPPAFTESELRTLEQLRSISGPEFDEVYVALLRKSYDRTVDDYSRYLQDPAAPQAALARDTLRRLNEHLTHIRGLSAPAIG